MLSAIGSAFSAVAGFLSWLTGWEQRKAGRQQQQLADAQASNKTLAAERDAAATAGTAEDAAKRDAF